MGGRGASSGGGGGNGLAANAKMPALTGSEKQVAWANDIRGKALAAADNAVATAEKAQAAEDASVKKYGFAATINSVASPASAKEARTEFVNVVKQATSAKAFIDNRSRFTEQAVQKQIIGRAQELDRSKKRR